jgi:hypothetical protein
MRFFFTNDNKVNIFCFYYYHFKAGLGLTADTGMKSACPYSKRELKS